MSVFAAPDFDDHEHVLFATDPETGLKCIIAIHDTHLGPALGGTRMWNYDTEDEALADALRLSRGMTYKAAVAGLNCGGGKAVIIGNSKTDKTDVLMRAYGRVIDSLGGRYVTAEDVGTTVTDMDAIAEETAHVRGASRGAGNPSPFTAYGVFLAMQAAVEHATGKKSIEGLRVAVQGVGNVGYDLCRYLAEAGARLVVTDIDKDAVARAVREFRAEAVDADAIYAVDADVFAPSALGAVLNDETIPILKAQIVAGSANNQLAEDRHGDALKRRRILYVPDYVANAGGLIGVAHDGPGYDEDEVWKKVGGIYATVKQIIARAATEDAPTNVVADRSAEERFAQRPTTPLAA